MLTLALGLAVAACLAHGLGPGWLGGAWALGGLAGSRICKEKRGPARWILVGGWLLLGLTGLRALPESQDPRARGAFQERRQGHHRTMGELAGHGVPVQLPEDFARDGDRLSLHPSALRIRWAAAPGETAEDHSWMADPAQIRRHGAAPPSPWGAPDGILRLRERVANRLEGLEGEHDKGLARALLLGKSEVVDPGLKDLFTRTGTRHLLALSGLHVGLMWWLFMRPLGQALAGLLSLRFAGRGLPRPWQARVATLLQVLGLLVFLPMLGGGTPALRATLALGLADCAQLIMASPGAPPGSGRRVDPLSIWSLALVLELLWRPESIASISLQLSYGATLGLIVFWKPCQAICTSVMERWIDPVAWESDSLGNPRHAAWPWLIRVASNFFVGGVLASVIATLSTLPFIWVHFGEWSPMGIVGTLILLPLVALGLLLGWVHVVLPWWLPKSWAAWPFARIPERLEALDHWAFTPHLLPAHSPALVVLAFALGALVFYTARTPHPVWLRRSLQRTCLGALGFLALPQTSPPKSMTVHVCDVGHGTAILTQMPCGQNWLFDAGSRDRKGVATRAVLPLIRKLGITDLHVVISHGDRDHQAALSRIASRVNVLTHTGPHSSFHGHDTGPLSVTGLDWDVDVGTLDSSTCSLGRCRVRILRGLDESGNEGSRNLWLECDGRRVLLCGDAEDQGLANVLPKLKGWAPWAAVLIPHHGSEQKNLGCLISHTSPMEVWFSASKRSPLAQNWPYPNTTTRWTAIDGGWSREFKPIKKSAGNL